MKRREFVEVDPGRRADASISASVAGSSGPRVSPPSLTSTIGGLGYAVVTGLLLGWLWPR
jgi:hypothetical protein